MEKKEFFRHLEEDADDIRLSAYVRRHFDLEAEEMHAALTDEEPDAAAYAQTESWLDGIMRKRRLQDSCKKAGQWAQKAAVFALVLLTGCALVLTDVQAVRDAVTAEIHLLNPYYFPLHVQSADAEEQADYSRLEFGWLPGWCRIKEDEGILYLRSGQKIRGAVLYTEVGFILPNEAASAVNIELSGFTKVTLMETSGWSCLIGLLPDSGQVAIQSSGSELTAADMIKMLQNLRMEE